MINHVGPKKILVFPVRQEICSIISFINAKCIGNGEIYCRAEQTLDCETDQGGKVFYKGKPQVTTTSNNQPHRTK